MQVLGQYQDFLENRGPFADSTNPNIHNVSPHEWWDAMGGGAKALQIIARRILGQVCSASACERNWSMYSFVHNKVRNRLKHDRAEDLVYIYTNSRLLRHHRGPKPSQWYGLNTIHSDDDSDGEDLDDDIHLDSEEGGRPPINDIDTNDLDFDLDDLDDDGANSDGNNSNDGEGRNIGVFDFDEDDMPQEHVIQLHDQDSNVDGPSFGQLCCGQGLWVQQNGVTDISKDRENDVPSTQAHSDSLSFGVEGEEVHIQEETSVLKPTRVMSHATHHTISVHDTNKSFDSNQTTKGCTLPPTSTTDSPNALNISSENVQNPTHIASEIRPLTQSVTSTNRIGTRSISEVGATLVSLQNKLSNIGQGHAQQPCDQLSNSVNTTNTPETSLLGHSKRLPSTRGEARAPIGIGERAMIPIVPATIRVGCGRGEPTTNTNEVASITKTGNVASSSKASNMGHRRTTRGVKRQCRYQGRAYRFAGDDYDPSDGRPNLDENGVRDIDGSRPTRRLVVTRDERLRLRSVSPQSDDDESTDDSDEDPRCIEANDPTVRFRTS
jgi:hypothetical protein